MLQASIIGNLGGDAREESANGSKFLSFNVADTHSWVDDKGQKHETTQWVSCALAGNYANLQPYLLRGKQVFVQGRLSVRIYSSPKERRMVAGINIAVDKIELIGGRLDTVPSKLYTADGVMVDVTKAYFVHPDVATICGASEDNLGMLQSIRGELYSVNNIGWVNPINEENKQKSDEKSETNS